MEIIEVVTVYTGLIVIETVIVEDFFNSDDLGYYNPDNHPQE